MTKFAAIKQFPTPKTVKDICTFLEQANQLASFVPDFAHMTSCNRPLLKKWAAWIWLDEQKVAFEKIKNLLTSDLVIYPLDSNLETKLLTDTSRPNGMGFALVQMVKGNMRLIQCGSSSLTPTHQRYVLCILEYKQYNMHKEMQLLSAGTAVFWGLDRSQTTFQRVYMTSTIQDSCDSGKKYGIEASL